jgi:hypothetical protein
MTHAPRSHARSPLAPGALLLLVVAALSHCSSSSSPSSSSPAASGEDAASGDAASGDAASGDAASGDAASGDAASGDDAAGGDCFPDNDGVTGNPTPYIFDVMVNDTGFSKMLLTTQNSSPVMLTLTNTGTKPHGFKVECTSVTPAYPTVPAGCPTTACFPAGSTIAPLAPGASTTVTFMTPIPDSLIYPFNSNEPDDSNVPALNDGQWSLM